MPPSERAGPALRCRLLLEDRWRAPAAEDAGNCAMHILPGRKEEPKFTYNKARIVMTNNTSLTKTDIQPRVISVLNDVTMDWDLELPEGIGSSTRLMEDLGFESIDVVQLVVSLEQEFDRKSLPFEQLFMQEGDYVPELTVDQVTGFLEQNL